MNTRVLLAAAALGLSVATQAGTYLALGDSIAFGLTPDSSGLFGYNAPSDGNRYYVASLASAVGASSVVNLSIPGETSSSFGDLTNIYRGGNTHYGSNPFAPTLITQFDFAQQIIQAPGANVTTVSFALGANDFLHLDGTLQSDPIAIMAAFASITDRYSTFLGTLHSEIPNARLVLPGYYNPFEPGSAKHAQADQVVLPLNALIQSFATTYGGTYVDFYTPIEGHQDTLLATGDIHPNAAGYAVLGQATARAVPEPGSLAALGLGALALMRRRRK